MAEQTKWIVFFCFVTFTFARDADDRIYFKDIERPWNTPSELTAGSSRKQSINDDAIQPRFLPFSASFSIAAGGNNAHSLSVGGNHEGISLSQSANQNDQLRPFSNSGSLSASQSSSFSAGLSGISASDSNAFGLNHPHFGSMSQADSNSFSFGDANASSHGKVDKGKVTSGAHSSVGNSQSSISSGASSSAERGGSSSEATAEYLQNQNRNQQYGRPYWNISPNYGSGDYGSRNSYRPTLQIGVQPQSWSTKWRRPSQLDISINDNQWYPRVPEVRITDGGPYGSRPRNVYSCYRRPYTFSNSREEYEWNNRCVRNVNNYRYQKQEQSDLNFQFHSPISSTQSSSPFWNNQHHQKPGLQISVASANSGASSTGNGFSFSQSSSQSHFGQTGPSSSTFNHVQTSGNGHSNSQGAAASVHQNPNEKVDASFSSSAIVGSSNGNGESTGISSSENKRGNSLGQVTNQVSGSGSTHGTANSGSASSSNFPRLENSHIIPSEFVRSQKISNSKSNSRKFPKDPFDHIVSEITDAVVEIFDI